MAEYVDITLEEMDAFLEKAQGFRLSLIHI